jgi:indole-3-glycerol phosphate synthase
MTILKQILDHKKTELPQLKEQTPLFKRAMKNRSSLYEILIHADRLQVIAEMKRASPSKGNIAVHTDPVEQASQYEKAGAACISVLTETKYFKGSYQDLNDVADTVSIPVLCKDFIIDEVQIDYAKAAGASVILLIVAALSDKELARLHTYAIDHGLEVLVEVHDIAELARALAINARIIGVNNRNLNTFEVDLKQTKAVAQAFKRSDIAFISESGIWNEEDAALAADYGATGILVGESLMRSNDVEAALQALQVELKAGEVR